MIFHSKEIMSNLDHAIVQYVHDACWKVMQKEDLPVLCAHVVKDLSIHTDSILLVNQIEMIF